MHQGQGLMPFTLNIEWRILELKILLKKIHCAKKSSICVLLFYLLFVPQLCNTVLN